MSMGGGGSQTTELPALFKDYDKLIQPALEALFQQNGLNLPAVAAPVASPVPLYGDINAATQYNLSAGGPTGTAIASLGEMAQTGKPTDTSAAIASREAIRSRQAAEGSAQIAEQYGSRGQRLGSGIGVGTGDFLAKLDESFAQQEADIGVAASEAAAKRQIQASTILPGILPQTISSASGVANTQQALAQMPLDAQRAELLRQQQGLQYYPSLAASSRGAATQQFGPSPIPGLIGGVGSLGSLFAAPAGGTSAASGIGDAATALFK